MEGGLVGGSEAVALRQVFRQVPHPVQEALAALDGLGVPGGGLFKIAQEHLVQAHGVGAVFRHDVVGVDHVVQGLGHLDDGMLAHLAVFFHQMAAGGGLVPVLGQQLFLVPVAHIVITAGVQAQDHAVAGALLIGLGGGHHADIIQEFMPKTAV